MLDRYRDTYWLQHIKNLESQYLTFFLNGNEHQKDSYLEELQKLFGGMGSFNDFVIDVLNGHQISSRHDAITATNELNVLRSKLYIVIQKEKMRPS